MIFSGIEEATRTEEFLACAQIDFTCKRCGRCCKDMDGIAYNSVDTSRMAKHLGIPKNEFIRKYTVQSKVKDSDRWLKTTRENACPWRSPAGCTAYEGRGQVCRFYPWYSPRNVIPVRDDGVFHIFQNCPGMMNHWKELMEQASKITIQDIDNLNYLLKDVGKMALLIMVKEEGKEDMAKAGAKSLGYADLVTPEQLRESCHKFCVCYVRANTSDKLIEETLTWLHEVGA